MADQVRTHQSQIEELADDVNAGVYPKKFITLDCTPGGGKTGSGVLLANHLLDKGTIDSVLWLVPRLSLAEQVASSFESGFASRKGRCLTVADPQDHLFAPNLPNTLLTVGHITTYQTVAHARNYASFARAMANRRTLAIFDEVQFLNDDLDRGWYSKVNAVKNAAAFNLFMSGTLWRTDDKPIPFIEYSERDAQGKRYPLCDISYTLRQAVDEKAVLPTEWRNTNGTVEYHYEGRDRSYDLLDDNKDEESRKLETFLASQNAVGSLLDRMVCDWREWCRRTYQSRMIVMADSIREAMRWRDYLQQRHDISCVLATSKEEAAGRKLRHFRERRHGQCLVTVAMAYVGFDCPDLTHLAYLSTIRAPAWMLQSAARISRYDPKAPVDYDHQHAFAYAPDDERLRRFAAWTRSQTDMGIADRVRRQTAKKKDGIIPETTDFEPISAQAAGTAVESLKSRLEPAVVARLEAFVRTCPAAADMPLSKLHEILSTAGVTLTPPGSPLRNGT